MKIFKKENEEIDFEKIKEIMVTTLSCDEEKIAPGAELSANLKTDSLDAVELVMAIEEELGVKIPDEELSNMRTVKDIIDCVEKYQT